jgi:broad specificity phosphatase PhoE
MATRLLLVRHGAHADLGRVLSGRSDACGLTPAGEAAVAAVADRLARGPKPLGLMASPRRRAQETASLLARALNLAITTEPALDEIDFGAWTARDFAALEDEPAWQQWNSQRATAQPPRGEAMHEAASRLLRWIATLPERYPAGLVIAVTHADLIKAALLAHLGASLDGYWRLEVAPASVSILELWPGGGRVLGINLGAGETAE